MPTEIFRLLTPISHVRLQCAPCQNDKELPLMYLLAPNPTVFNCTRCHAATSSQIGDTLVGPCVQEGDAESSYSLRPL